MLKKKNRKGTLLKSLPKNWRQLVVEQLGEQAVNVTPQQVYDISRGRSSDEQHMLLVSKAMGVIRRRHLKMKALKIRLQNRA